MVFVELSEKEYRTFWEESEQKCFLSAPELGRLDGQANVYFLGIKEKERVLSAVMVRGMKNRIGKIDFYAPGGVLVDYLDFELLSATVSGLKDFLKHKNGLYFRMNPNVLRVERDIDGRVVSGGFDNRQVERNLERLGLTRFESPYQITWQFVLPVKNKTEEELLAGMKPNTRRRLKQALELGIYTRKLEYSELKDFYKILLGTGERRGFLARDLGYFQKMYNLFSERGEIEFVSAMINPKKSFERLGLRLREVRDSCPSSLREERDKIDKIKSLETRVARLKTCFPRIVDEEVTLSSGMFMTIKPEILHLFGGNAGELMKLDGQYVLQWEMIRKALEGDYSRYNFYGISPNINKSSKDYGVYEFKRGFGGAVEELIGEFRIPLSPIARIKDFHILPTALQ